MTINYKEIIENEINSTINDIMFSGMWAHHYTFKEINDVMGNHHNKQIIKFSIRLANALNEYKKLEEGKV